MIVQMFAMMIFLVIQIYQLAEHYISGYLFLYIITHTTHICIYRYTTTTTPQGSITTLCLINRYIGIYGSWGAMIYVSRKMFHFTILLLWHQKGIELRSL